MADSPYEYIIKRQGPKKWVVVNKDGAPIYTGSPSFSASEESLMDEAYQTLKGNFPDIPKGSTPPPPNPPINSDPPASTPPAPIPTQTATYEYTYSGRVDGNDVIITVKNNGDLPPFDRIYVATSFTVQSATSDIKFKMDNFGEFANNITYPPTGDSIPIPPKPETPPTPTAAPNPETSSTVNADSTINSKSKTASTENVDLKTVSFSNTGDIETFFQKYDNAGFVSWFNNNRSRFLHKSKSLNAIKDKNSWSKFWNLIDTIYGKSSINLAEFLTVTNIVCIETGSSYSPKTERVGSSGHPGIAHAFDEISGVKKSYNTLSSNKNAFQLFNDQDYLEAHGHKTLSSNLKNTTDVRWKGDSFPVGFSGDSNKEVNTSGGTNDFIFEADFMKFRGRGFVQTTGRSEYTKLVDIVKSYSGQDSIMNQFKEKWNNGDTNDKILSQSTNKEWDSLFNDTNSILPAYAFGEFSESKNNLYHINISSDKTVNDGTYNAGKQTNGGNDYGNDIKAIVNVQMTELAVAPTDPDQADVPEEPTPPTEEPNNENTDGGEDNDNGYPNDLPKVKGLTNFNRPTIKIEPIKFDLPADEGRKKEVASTVGYQPFVWYEAYQLKFIKSLILSSRGLLPTIKLVFTDTLNIMSDDGFPLDDSKIKIFLNSRTPSLRPIFMEFKISNFSRGIDNTFTIEGICNVNKFFLRQFESYSNMTSFECMKEFSRRAQLGFNSNVAESDDRMNWINPGKRGAEFVKDVISSSYRSDESFIWCYVDYYYNMNYIDVEEALKINISNQLQVKNTGLEAINQISNNKEETSQLWLSNDPSMDQTNQYFDDWKIINNSTSISLQNGYLTKAKFYDINDKNYLIFDVDSITSEGDRTIIMKGSPQDMEFYNNHIKPTYVGKLDTDNMHDNFNYSLVQNTQNIKDIQKIGVTIKLKTPNYNLYRYQKINVVFSAPVSTASAAQVNNRLTGDWLIIDIAFILVNGEYNQKLTLIKRELELSPEELARERGNTESESNQNSSDNANPSPEDVDGDGVPDDQGEDDDTIPFSYDLKFKNADEIDEFFNQYNEGGFVGWFNKEFGNDPDFTNNVLSVISESESGSQGTSLSGESGEYTQKEINKQNWSKIWNSSVNLIYNDNRGGSNDLNATKKSQSTTAPNDPNGTDPNTNLASEYLYITRTEGPKKWIVVEKSGQVIYTGDKSFSTSEADLINNAYLFLLPNYPDIPNNNATVPTSNPVPSSTPEQTQSLVYEYTYAGSIDGDTITITTTSNSDLPPFDKEYVADNYTIQSAIDDSKFKMDQFGDYVNGVSYPKTGDPIPNPPATNPPTPNATPAITAVPTTPETSGGSTSGSESVSSDLTKSDFNVVEFLALNTMIYFLSGTGFKPKTDNRPITELFASNNTYEGNNTSFDSFNDSDYIEINENKPFADSLKNTTDTRWEGTLYPTGFSGDLYTGGFQDLSYDIGDGDTFTVEYKGDVETYVAAYTASLPFEFTIIDDRGADYQSLVTKVNSQTAFDVNVYISNSGFKKKVDYDAGIDQTQTIGASSNTTNGLVINRDFNDDQVPLRAGNSADKEISKDDNEFITNSDFFKFRERGLVKFRGRHDYGTLINFINSYSGENPVVKEYKEKWSTETEISITINKSTDADWKKLIDESDLVIPAVGMSNVLFDLKSVHLMPTEGKNERKIFNSIENLAKLVKSSFDEVPKNFETDYVKMVKKQITLLNNTELPSNSSSGTNQGDSSTEDAQPTPNPKALKGVAADISNLKSGGKFDSWKARKKIGTEDTVVYKGVLVSKKIAPYLVSMIEAGKKDGIKYSVNSGFRTNEDQVINGRTKSGQYHLYDIWTHKNKKKHHTFPDHNPSKPGLSKGGNLAAYPGSSNHQNGRAVDIGPTRKGTKGYKWMIENAWKYGFVRSVKRENWHWEYRPGTHMFAYVPKDHPSWDGIPATVGLA